MSVFVKIHVSHLYKCVISVTQEVITNPTPLCPPNNPTPLSTHFNHRPQNPTLLLPHSHQSPWLVTHPQLNQEIHKKTFWNQTGALYFLFIKLHVFGSHFFNLVPNGSFTVEFHILFSFQLALFISCTYFFVFCLLSSIKLSKISLSQEELDKQNSYWMLFW